MRREVQSRHIHLPVVDGERSVGMLSLRDILRADLAQKTERKTPQRGTSEVESITKYIQRDDLGGLG